MSLGMLKNLSSKLCSTGLCSEILPKQLNLARYFSVTTSCNDKKPASTRTLSGASKKIFGFIPPFMHKPAKRSPKTTGFGPGAFSGKPVQEWHEWDGFGPYKYGHHHMVNNRMNRDFQHRRIFKIHHERRMRINCIRKAELLPKEIRRVANKEIIQVPRNSSITAIKRRCTLSGRARGIFHQFRVSRLVFRMQADYNKVSGVQRAHWLYSTHIKP